MVACQNARHHMVSEFLDHGADCNAEDNDGWTPLLLAVKAGKLNICLNLLDHGAQIDHREMVIDIKQSKIVLYMNIDLIYNIVIRVAGLL